MGQWINQIELISSPQRWYGDGHLQMAESFEDGIEICIYNFPDHHAEVYFRFIDFHGVICGREKEISSIKDELKSILEIEYIKNKKTSSEFIESLNEKFDISIPFMV